MQEYVEIRLVNSGECGVGLRDTEGRFYDVPLNGQLRINLTSFKSLLDYPASKRMICEGLVKVEGITEDMLMGSVLSDEERAAILGDAKVKSTDVEETNGIVETHVETEQVHEVPIVKAITFYNWIKNEKEDKLREALKNPVNYDTLQDIVAKNGKYNTDLVKKLLSE